MSFFASNDRIYVSDTDGSVVLDTDKRMPCIVQTITSNITVEFPGYASYQIIPVGRASYYLYQFGNSSTSQVIGTVPTGCNFVLVQFSANFLRRNSFLYYSSYYQPGRDVYDLTSIVVEQGKSYYVHTGSMVVESIDNGNNGNCFQQVLHFEIVGNQLIVTAETIAFAGTQYYNGPSTVQASQAGSITTMQLACTFHLGVAR